MNLERRGGCPYSYRKRDIVFRITTMAGKTHFMPPESNTALGAPLPS